MGARMSGNDFNTYNNINSGYVKGRVVEYEGEKWRVTSKSGSGADAHASLDIVNPPGSTGAQVQNKILRLPLAILRNLPTVTE